MAVLTAGIYPIDMRQEDWGLPSLGDALAYLDMFDSVRVEVSETPTSITIYEYDSLDRLLKLQLTGDVEAGQFDTLSVEVPLYAVKIEGQGSFALVENGEDGADILGYLTAWSAYSTVDSSLLVRVTDIYQSLEEDLILGAALLAGADAFLGSPQDDYGLLYVGEDTAYGGEGADTLDGGDGHDFAQGNQGNDYLKGGLGNDTLRGGKDHDVAYGGAGNDEVYGDLGNDTLDGGDSDDLVRGGRDDDYITDSGLLSNDVILGDLGNDILYGGDGADILHGDNFDNTVEGGDDFLQGNQGDDYLEGGLGNDTLRGGKDYDEADGGEGDDEVYGDLADDIVYGGDGDDIVRGGQNDDFVFGDAGSDTLYGDRGNDLLYGGDGADVFVFDSESGIDVVPDFDLSLDFIALVANLNGSGIAEPGDVVSRISTVNGDAVIDLGAGYTVTLEGLDAAQLTESMFLII